MEKPISLSVVVCTYNGAKYLRPQLDSLLQQTLMPMEILIHDDGSIDDTLDIAYAYAEKHPIIRVMKNGGRHGVNANFLAALHMHYFHSGLKSSGTNTHKRDTVAMRFIHICLNFKYKCRKRLCNRVNKSFI